MHKIYKFDYIIYFTKMAYKFLQEIEMYSPKVDSQVDYKRNKNALDELNYTSFVVWGSLL